jgi:hypothetical protein
MNDRGEPRMAFSSGAFAEAPFSSYQLYYLWCTNGCASSAANWTFNNVGIPLTAGGVDLALDNQDRPRIAHLTGEGLSFTWCNRDAETGDSNWQRKVVESNESLSQNYEVLPIHRCTVSKWVNAERCYLSLDPQGNPGIGYDAQHLWTGVYVDRPWEDCYVEDVTVTRFATFTLAPSLSIRRTGDGLEITFANGVLETAPDMHSPWKALTAAESPVRVRADQAMMFFRVRE